MKRWSRKHPQLHRFLGRYAWYRKKLWSHAWWVTLDVVFIYWMAKRTGKRWTNLFGASR